MLGAIRACLMGRKAKEGLSFSDVAASVKVIICRETRFFPFGEQDKAFVLWNIDSSDKETFRKEGLHPFPHVPCLVFLLFRGAARVFFCPKPLSEALYLTVSSFQNNGLVRWPRSEMGSHSYWFDLEKRRKELPSLGLSKISIVLLCGKVWVHHLD